MFNRLILMLLSFFYLPILHNKYYLIFFSLFLEITEAYNCLNDPKERSWYDSNRERLLMNKDDLTREDLEL